MDSIPTAPSARATSEDAHSVDRDTQLNWCTPKGAQDLFRLVLRIAYLEKKVQTKDEVLAELMAEHVALKKRVGEL